MQISQSRRPQRALQTPPRHGGPARLRSVCEQTLLLFGRGLFEPQLPAEPVGANDSVHIAPNNGCTHHEWVVRFAFRDRDPPYLFATDEGVPGKDPKYRLRSLRFVIHDGGASPHGRSFIIFIHGRGSIRGPFLGLATLLVFTLMLLIGVSGWGSIAPGMGEVTLVAFSYMPLEGRTCQESGSSASGPPHPHCDPPAP